MSRQLSLTCTLLVLGGLTAAAPASAHIPFGSPDNPQWGCITTSDPWTGTNPSGVGPFDGALVAAAAPNNTCGRP
jgi:hypothetical protein